MTAAMRFLPLLLLASEAAAAPCEVSIPRAPDDVREAIETWVRAEPRCATPLEVRVVPTEGGYYLFARDPSGQVRERVVPDAQSAGVLVASWVAEDAPPGPLDPAPESTVIELSSPATVVIEAPGAMPAMVLDQVAAPRRSLRPARWLSLGGTIRMEDGGGGGARAELDLRSWGPWSAGLALAMSRSYTNNLLAGFDTGWHYSTLQTVDLRAAAVLARTSRFGAWELRFTGGLGVVRTSADGFTDEGASYDGTTITPFAEGSAQLSRRLGSSWALGAGPVVTLYKQTIDGTMFDYQASEVMPSTVTREHAEVSMFAGLRRAL